MNEIIEYYLMNVRMRMGRKELALELLRKDSILRYFFGFDAGHAASMSSKANIETNAGDNVLIDFGKREKLKLDGDPTPQLKELKLRYGDAVGGVFYFALFYTTFARTTYFEVDLDRMEH